MLLVARCPGCGVTGRAPCARCLAELAPPAPAALPAVFAYEGVGRAFVLALKAGHGRAAIPALGAHLAAVAGPLVSADRRSGSTVWVTWAPTSAIRRRRRGFDQAELLARVTARRLGLPCRALLWRLSEAPQQGQKRTARIAGPAFAARRPLRGASVLVIDDVVTTGATLAAAAAALWAAGAGAVHQVALASAGYAR